MLSAAQRMDLSELLRGQHGIAADQMHGWEHPLTSFFEFGLSAGRELSIFGPGLSIVSPKFDHDR